MTANARLIGEETVADRPCKIRAPCSWCSFNPDGDCPHNGIRADGRDYRGRTLAPGRHITHEGLPANLAARTPVTSLHPKRSRGRPVGSKTVNRSDQPTLGPPQPGDTVRTVPLAAALAYCRYGRWPGE